METQTSCRQCGTCCRKGGPAFHMEDRQLIDAGKIQASQLFTIRRGEPAHENVQGNVAPVETDIIKIKGEKGWECLFLDPENHCRIYTHRPVECRALTCWDTQNIQAVYRTRRLTRRDLLETVAGLWDLVSDHQRRCDYDLIRQLAGKTRTIPDPAARDRLHEIIAFDTQVRTLTIEQGGLDPDLTDFLFGRPLTLTLPGMGIPLKKNR